MENPTAILASLIEILIEADPDELLEKHADILTPNQLWRACQENMGEMLKYAGDRQDAINHAAEMDATAFIEEYEGEWDPALLAKMVEENPDDCLSNIPEKLSPEQKQACIEADLITAAHVAKDELTNEQVQRLVKEQPETALACLAKRLDDETFQALALKFPNTAWYTDPQRVNVKFIEKHLLDAFDPMEQLTKARKLSKEQVTLVLAAHPELVWNDVRKTFDEIPKDQRPPTPTKKWVVWAVGVVATAVGIVIGVAICAQ